MSLDKHSRSLYRRLAFADATKPFFNRLFTRKPLSRFVRVVNWGTPRIPDTISRIGFDLFECLRTGSRVPEIGDIETALIEDKTRRIPQAPEYLTYWHDPANHSLAAMHVCFDLFRHQEKYYVYETNFGPYFGPWRRKLYDTPIDPLITNLLATASALGFKTVVPVAWEWPQSYVEEFETAGKQHGLSVQPANCSLPLARTERSMLTLPRPLAPDTMYYIQNGFATPLIRYIDSKWYSYEWLENAIENELPSDTLVAVPPTYDRLTLPPEDPDPRWPNLVVKLAESHRSLHVIAGRFDDEDHAREALGLRGGRRIPRQLRSAYALSRLFGGNQIIYQGFIPPPLDEDGCAESIRLHVLLSPLGAEYLSGHVHLTFNPIPKRLPRGVIQQDDAYIANRSNYKHIPPEQEEELRIVADQLGQAMQRAIHRRFEISPPDQDRAAGSR